MRKTFLEWVYCTFCGINYNKNDTICPNCGTAPHKHFKRGSQTIRL